LGDADDIFTEKANIVDTSVQYAVYAVDYWVTDADNNIARGKNFVLVDWVGGPDFVKARSFVTGAPNFTELQGTQTHLAGTDAFILEKSAAAALRFNTLTGALDTISAAVAEAALYKAQGPLVDDVTYPNGRDFALSIGVENPINPGQPIKNITARVMPFPVIGDGPYFVGAKSSVALTSAQAATVAGPLDAAKRAQLITWASAQAWYVDVNDDILDWDVEVQSSQIPVNPVALVNYEVVFIAKNHPEVNITTKFIILGVPPVITFLDAPLVITQTPGQSHILTQAELKARMTATDVNDDGTGGRAANYTFTNTTATVAGGGSIDTQNVGVYKVSYFVTDLDGMTATATRAVVVDDGRYEYEDPDGDGDIDIIIGARDYAIQSKDVDGTEAQAKTLSYAEAYDNEGTALPVAWIGVPAGYVAKAPVGDYAITWTATKGTLVGDKAIAAHVLDADVLDPGDKNSQYAIAANNFSAKTTQAAEILANDSFGAPQWANVKVIKLVAAAADKTYVIEDRGGYQAVEKANPGYQVTFRIAGIPATTQKVTIDAAVTALASYRVDFNANGGTLTGPLAIYVVEPATTLAYLPDAPIRQDYTFTGWNTAANGAGAGFNAATQITGNITVYAQWTRNAVVIPPDVIVYPPDVIVGGGTTIYQTEDVIEAPTYITVQPNDDLTSLDDKEIPLGDPEPTQTAWSLFDVCCAILALLLFAAFIVKFFVDRRRRDEDEYYGRQPKNQAMYVNLPVLLVSIIALIETAILLFTTQDFTAAMTTFDQFSVVFALIVFVLLFAPMVAAAFEAHSNNRRYSQPAQQAQAQTPASQTPIRSVTL
jgi:uncharacterized repeat protein (TIGR02543 family)